MKKFQKAISLLLTLAMILSAGMQVYAASPIDDYDGLSNDTETAEEVNEVVSEEPTQSPQSDNNPEETPTPTQTMIEEDYLSSEDIVLGDDDFTDPTPTPTSTPTATPTPEAEENISDAVVLNYAELEVSFYDYVITASGNMPENAVLNVSKVFNYDTLEEQIGDEDYHIYAAFDIQILVDGVEWQPLSDNEEIQITLKTIDSDTNNEASVSAEDTIVYRIFDDSDIEDIAENNDDIEVSDIDKVTELATEVSSDNSVTVNTDHFTVYTFGGKTVNTPNGKTATYLSDYSGFPTRIKRLVDSSAGWGSKETTIKNIRWASEAWDNLSSSTNLATSGNIPVYAHLVNEDDNNIVELYTDADIVYLNQNSKWLFYEFEGLVSLDIFSSKLCGDICTNMNGMFKNCKSLVSLDLSNLNTLNVTDMKDMFNYCQSLVSLDLSNFDTHNVTNMDSMFENCQSLVSLDLSNFNTLNVTNMTDMFNSCKKLSSLNVSNFNVSNVENMRFMFSNCESLISLDLSSFGTTKTTSTNYMFSNCESLASLDISNFSAPYATDMSNMFSRCSSLTSLDLSNLNTLSATNMESMFNYCNSLTSLDMSGLNTSNVTTMEYMFSNCKSLTSLDVSGFNTSNVTNMKDMFSHCESLTSLDVSGFNTSNVTNMASMFSNCKSLTSLDVSNFNTSNATNMSYMFISLNLTSLDISNFNTSNCTNMSYMFAYGKFTELDLSNFDLSNPSIKVTAIFKYSLDNHLKAICLPATAVQIPLPTWMCADDNDDNIPDGAHINNAPVSDTPHKYTIYYTLYFYKDTFQYTNNSSNPLHKTDICYGGIVEEPQITIDGYIIDGWRLNYNDEDELFDFSSTPITSNYRLIAVKHIAPHYSVDISWKNTTDKNISEDVTSGENFDISYILHITTSAEYDTNNLEVRVPYALWRHKVEQFPTAYSQGRFTEYLIPSDIGCAKAPATSNDVAFNYYIDTKDTDSAADDELVFKNFQSLGSGNTSTSTDIEVRYTIKPFVVKDMSKLKIYAHASGQSAVDSEPVTFNVDGSDALTYQLDTGFDSSTSSLRSGDHWKYKFLYGKSTILESTGSYLNEDDIDTENYVYVGYGLKSDDISTNMASQLYTYRLTFEDTNYPTAEAITWRNHGSYWYRADNGCAITGNEWNDDIGARVKQTDGLGNAMIAGSSNIHGTVVVRYPKDEVLNSGKKLNGNFVVDIIAMDEDSHTSPDDNDYFEMSWSTGDITYTPYRYPYPTIDRSSYINIEGNNPQALGPSQLLPLKYGQDTASGQIDAEYGANISALSQNDPAQGYVATQKYHKTDVYFDNFYWNLGDDNSFVKMTEEDYEISLLYSFNMCYDVVDVTCGNVDKPRDAEHIIGDVIISGYNPSTGIWEEVSTLNISDVVDSSNRLCFSKETLDEGEEFSYNNTMYKNSSLLGRGYTKLKIESPMVQSGYLQVRPYLHIKFKGDSPTLQEYLSNHPDTTQIKVACISGSKHYHTAADDATNTLIYDDHYTDADKNQYNIPWYFQTLSPAELESQCPNMLSEIYAEDVASGFYGSEYTTGGMQRQCYIGYLSLPSMYSDVETWYYDVTNDTTNRRIKATVQTVATEQIDTRDNTWPTTMPDIVNNFTGKYAYVYELLPEGYYIDESSVRLYAVQNYRRSMPFWYKEGSINDNFQAHKDEYLKIIDNYNNTGRQMVIIKWENNEDFIWFNRGDQGWGYYTGAQVRFDMYCDWTDIIYNRTIGESKILTAYQCSQAIDGEDRTVVGNSSSNIGYPDAFDDSNQTVQDFKAVTSNIDGSYAFAKIWRGGTINGTQTQSTLYDSCVIAPDVAMSVESGLSKTVKGALQKYQTTDEIGINRPYSYRINVTNSATGTLNNVVLYDILETAEIAGETGWKGTFDSVNTTYAESLGINPKVYYSTADLEYTSHLLNNSAQSDTWLDDGIVDGTWKLLDNNVDKATIKAVAVDLRKKTDGSNFNVPNSGILYAIINMKSPSVDPRDTDENKISAYNKAASSYTQSGSNYLILGPRTRISLATKDITVSVHWNDCDNWYENRPDKIRITLYADDIDTGKYVELDTDDTDINTEFTNLDVYNEDGKKIKYTVTQDAYNNDGILYEEFPSSIKNRTFYETTYEVDSSDENHLIVNNSREHVFVPISLLDIYYDTDNNMRPFTAADGAVFELTLQKPDGSYGYASQNLSSLSHNDDYIASPDVASEHLLTLNSSMSGIDYAPFYVEEGVLTITQIKAPNGSYALKEPLVLEIRKKISFGEDRYGQNKYQIQNLATQKTEYTQNNTLMPPSDVTYIIVINKTQAFLTTTGGKGTKFFLLLGLICIVFSLFIFLRYRRKHA